MIFKRLHIQLTALCALITITILSAFTALYLFVAEHNMKENLALTCRNHFDTLSGSLVQQTVFTYPYLLRMEQNNDCLIFLWDNGAPLSFNALETHADYQTLATSLYENYISLPPSSYPVTQEMNDFYIGISNISANGMSSSKKAAALKNNQGIVLLVLFPNTKLHERLLRQRLIFVILSLGGCLLLTLFSYFFTGRILKPLRENQDRQLAFIAGASHELRTPLAVILSAVSARPPRYEETIKTETLRMGHLVEELLLLSRLNQTDSPQQTPPFADLEPDTFLLDFYEQMENYVRSRKRALSLELPEKSVPKLSADAEKLRQLLEILLENALSYTEESGRISLGLSYDAIKKQLCFSVSDNGIGIPDAEKEKIFDRFYRGETARSSKEHFGLGLCIAREIVTAHKGSITAADASGGGTVFSCRFPAKKPDH